MVITIISSAAAFMPSIKMAPIGASRQYAATRCRPKTLSLSERIRSDFYLVCKADPMHDTHMPIHRRPTGLRMGLVEQINAEAFELALQVFKATVPISFTCDKTTNSRWS